MRRAERAMLLVGGAVFAPVVAAVGVPAPWRDAPVVAAVAVVAVLGNVSAARRIAHVAETLRARAPRPRPRVGVRPRERLAPLLARHQVGALVATAFDFSTMVFLVQAGGFDPVPATAVGAACGALTNFLVSRGWIFRAEGASPTMQVARYVLVSGASLVLNTTGQHILHHLLGVQYVIARVMVAVVVSVAWNFPMHRAFVFAREDKAREARAP
jgi:putative flippase GtrA